MKVAVINFSGNVGKTTVAGHLLRPRMNEAPLFSVESLNVDSSADGIEVEKLRGKQFGELQEQLLRLDSAIIDVGASNVEHFLKLMQQYDGSHEEYNFYVVPVVKERKQQADTVNTIRALSTLGIPARKIRTVFNKVETDDRVEAEFAGIFGLAEAEKSFTVNPLAVIYANEVFEKLKGIGKALGDIAADKTDYRALLRQTTVEGERNRLVKMIGVQQLARTASKNLDDAYTAIFQ